MINSKMEEILKYGAKVSWDAKYDGTQTWSMRSDWSYPYWDTGSYAPQVWVNHAGSHYPYCVNNRIEWSYASTYYNISAYAYMMNETSTDICPTVVEGTLNGELTINYHSQSVSYNLFCSSPSASYDSYWQYMRNANGLSFVIEATGGYWYGYVYQNGTLIGSLGNIYIGDYGSHYYTIKFRIVGNNLYAYFCTGEYNNQTLTLINNPSVNPINPSALTGRKTIVWVSSYEGNSQGCWGGGNISKISLVNYR